MDTFTDRQNQIIQESIQLIAQKGIQGLTIKNISKAIDVSEPAIYRHFENKNDIILGIISVLKNTTDEEIDAGADDANTIDLINKMFQRRTDRFIRNPSLTAVVFSEGIFDSSSVIAMPIRALMNVRHEKLVTMIENGQANGDIRGDINAAQLSLMVIGSFRFLVSKWHLTDYNFNLKTEVDELLNSIKTVLTC